MKTRKMMSNKRKKVAIKVLDILTVILLTWFVFSYVEVITHNTNHPGYEYSKINIFNLIFEDNPNFPDYKG